METKCKKPSDSVGLLFILLESLQKSSRESSTTFGDGHVLSSMPRTRMLLLTYHIPYKIHFFGRICCTVYLI